ncbi:ParA family protein [Streptomyces kaniharaensis]|uniref:ParA family protein n=1 Tax=Streptomyces kaniharaensis TaxID=212423 RepID=A0A6N7L6Y5_9ACTN|nr:ParA family protein [Streptomyces kaniharaensis]MQS18013.1 ParA family protein [Streptomyces kaniharaensis]
MTQVERVEHPPWDGEPIIISVFGGKGGIGKSTLAFLIAWLLGLVGRTLLVDADELQKEGGTKELYDLLEVDPSFDIATEEDPKKLAGLRRIRGYRFIVIDNAPHRDKKKLEASCDGDLIVVPLTLDHLEAKAIMSSLREIVIPSGRPYRVVINRVEANRKSKARRTHDSLDLVKIPVFKTHVRELAAHQDAGASGIPVTEGTNRTWERPAEDARNLVDELLAVLGQPDRVPRPRPAVVPKATTSARTSRKVTS